MGESHSDSRMFLIREYQTKHISTATQTLYSSYDGLSQRERLWPRTHIDIAAAMSQKHFVSSGEPGGICAWKEY